MRKRVLLAVLANAVMLVPVGSFARDAADCLAAPNAASPPGSHWYYRFDRPSRRKCWYLGAEGRKKSPSVTQVVADERRLEPTIPSAPTTGVVRQVDSDGLTEARRGDGRAMQPSVQSDPRNVPQPSDRAATESELDPVPPSANEQEESSTVWPSVPSSEPPAIEQPASEPASAQHTQWVYLLALLAGALTAAGYGARARLRQSAAGWFDRYAARVRPHAFSAPAMPVSDHDQRPGVASSQQSVPFVRAPNLAWLTDETLHQPDTPQPPVWRTDVRA
jgi:hypothetical protein